MTPKTKLMRCLYGLPNRGAEALGPLHFLERVIQVMDRVFFFLVFIGCALRAWAIRGRKKLGP